LFKFSSFGGTVALSRLGFCNLMSHAGQPYSFGPSLLFPLKEALQTNKCLKEPANRHLPKDELNISDKERLPNYIKIFSPWQGTGIYQFFIFAKKGYLAT